MSISTIESLQDFVDLINIRANRGYDTVIAISGEKNSGKSVLAQQIIKIFNSKRSNYDLIRDTVFADETAEDIMEKIKSKPKVRGLSLDEAIKWFYKMEWQNKKQNDLIKFITYAREYGKHIFLCIPYFSMLRTSFRNEYITFWVQIIKQGYAVVFIKDSNHFVEDKWHIKENSKIWGKKAGLNPIVTPDKQVEILAKTLNYIGGFPFSDLNPELKEKYLIRKREALANQYHKKEQLSSREIKYLTYFANLVAHLYTTKDYTQEKISNISTASKSTINKMLKLKKVRKVDKLPEILREGEI